MKKKIAFISSSGGHFEQLSILINNIPSKYDFIVVTEKTTYTAKSKKNYYVPQTNRKEFFFFFKFIYIIIKSFAIFLKEKPDIVISTGALISIPLCIIAKIFKRKLVFIESFAEVNHQTKTGKYLYKYSDVFIVQWKSMLNFYENAIFIGSIY